MSDILRIKRLFMRDGMLAVAKKTPSKYELFEVSIQNTVFLQTYHKSIAVLVYSAFDLFLKCG